MYPFEMSNLLSLITDLFFATYLFAGQVVLVYDLGRRFTIIYHTCRAPVHDFDTKIKKKTEVPVY